MKNKRAEQSREGSEERRGTYGGLQRSLASGRLCRPAFSRRGPYIPIGQVQLPPRPAGPDPACGPSWLIPPSPASPAGHGTAPRGQRQRAQAGARMRAGVRAGSGGRVAAGARAHARTGGQAGATHGRDARRGAGAHGGARSPALALTLIRT